MENSQEIIKELEIKFKEIKKEAGFKATLEELDEVFFIKDLSLKEGYVPTKLLRSTCHRISEVMLSWSNYLHSLIIPNPNYLISMTETQFFSDENKEEILNLLNKIMEFSSKNSLNSLLNNKKEDAKFIDNSLTFWKKELNPKLTEYMKKVNLSWKEKTLEKKK